MLELSLYSGYVLTSILSLLIGAVFMALQNVEDKAFLAKLFFAFLLIGILITPLYYEWLVATGYEGFSFADDKQYDARGWAVARQWLSGRSSAGFDFANNGYFYFTAFIYYIFGRNTLVARVFNVLASAICIVFVYKTALYYFGNKVAKRAALLMVLMPSFMYWAINHFKDPFVVLATCMIICMGSALITQQKLTIVQSITFVFAFLMLYMIRYTAAVFLALIIFGYFYLVCIKQFSIGRFVFVTSFLFIILFGIRSLTGQTSSEIQDQFKERFNLSAKMTIASGKEKEATTEQMVSFAKINSYREMYKLPVSCLVALVLPYPPLPYVFLDRVKLPHKILIALNFIFVCFLSYIFAGWFYLLQHDTRKAFLLYFIVLFYVIVIAISYLGVLRYKEQWLPLYAILAAVGIEHKQNYKLFIWTFNAFIIFIGPAVYLVLKSIN